MSRVPTPLREAVWRKDYSTIDGKCWVCNQNIISMMNFECGHIKSVKRGGSTTLDNLKAICGPCNKSMGVKDMLHYRTNLWRGRKQPKKKQATELKNNTFNIISNNVPRRVSQTPPVIIKIDNSNDIVKLYASFEQFIRPIAHMSDVSPWFETYICCLDEISKNSNNIKNMNIIQFLTKFSQCKTWYDTASGYARGKFSELLYKLHSMLNGF